MIPASWIPISFAFVPKLGTQINRAHETSKVIALKPGWMLIMPAYSEQADTIIEYDAPSHK